MSVKNDLILDALKKCLDPELGIDVVSLGLIYGIESDDQQATITMTLTTPGCPLVPYFEQDVISKVKQATQLDKVAIKLVFDPPWTPDKMSVEAKKQLSISR